MQLKAADLAGHLRGTLAPVYFVSGEETLLVEEACDAILTAARKAGFGDRSVLHAEAGFNWNDVIQDAASMSLFADRRIIDVRVPSAKFDRDASEVLRRYAEHPAQETLLLIRTTRLEGKQRSSAWFKALERVGVMVVIWPVEIQELPRWLAARAQTAGLTLQPAALALLAERVEGNLLAAVQELRALELAGLPAPISVEALQTVLDDSAHYDTFKLIDAAMAGDGARVSRIAQSLRQEGIAPFAVLGALTSQLRRMGSGGGGMPPQRQRLVQSFLQRLGSGEAVGRVLAECALVDAQGKGQIPGDAWLSLEDLLLRLCGVRPLPGGSPLRLLR
ncbi:MAG: DNA polymerase III subunit delta [Pseudomonadales bacterium]